MLMLLAAIAVQIEVAPSLPPGCNELLQKSVIAVTDALEKKDFAKARVLVTRLPRREIKVAWSDQNVPAIRRGEFQKARDEAFKTWNKIFPEFKFSVGAPAQIKISFQDTLPANADSNGPAGAVFFGSPEPSEPNVEAIIAMHRSQKRLSIEPKDVANEVRYAIGMYLGLERSPLPNTVMGRVDSLYTLDNNVAPLEGGTVKQIFKVVDTLSQAVAKEISLATSRPTIFSEPNALTHETILQGEVAQFNLSITNRGNATLNYRVVPDCGCIMVGAARSLQPSESAVVQVGVYTESFVGDVQKNLYIYSNDAEMPYKRIPIRLTVDPLYRFVREKPNNVIIPNGTPVTESLYLVLNEKKPLKIGDLTVEGVGATGKMTPWEGSIADASMNANQTIHKGYKIDITVPANIPPGRNAILVGVKTDSDLFPVLNYNLYTQAGIERSPQSIYLGEIPRAPKRAWIILSRPRIGFKIEKIVCSHPSLKASVEAIHDDWEYKIIVQFDGKAQEGTFIETVDVYTNDPKQKVIQIPIQAFLQ